MNELKTILSNLQYGESTLTVLDTRFTYIIDKHLYSSSTADDPEYSAMPLHSHLYYELLFIRNGNLIMHCVHGDISIRSGQCALISPCMQHLSTFAPGDFAYSSIGFSVSQCEGAPGLYDTIRSVLNFEGICKMNANRNMISAVDSLPGVWTENSPFSEAFAVSIAHSIVLSAIENIRQNGMHGAFWHRLNESSYPEHLQETAYTLDRYLNTNFPHPLTEESVAKMFYIGKRKLNEVVRMMYGQTLKQRIMFLRLSRAAYLLKSTDRSVEEIIHEVGYTSGGNFNQAFRQMYGINPGTYRRMHFAQKSN